mmetsp:Transcript_15256/g.35989  ORF Transcript_15256/g.35989 Transcript_15256/m.35989 type:complete len:96 (-) Transcript_15256:1629-1916(-)
MRCQTAGWRGRRRVAASVRSAALGFIWRLWLVLDQGHRKLGHGTSPSGRRALDTARIITRVMVISVTGWASGRHPTARTKRVTRSWVQVPSLFPQ